MGDEILKDGQMLGIKEIELLVVLVVRIQIGEHFNHQGCQLIADFHELGFQIGLLQYVPDVGMVRNGIRFENISHRGAEHQVFDQSGIVIVQVRVERLHELG